MKRLLLIALLCLPVAVWAQQFVVANEGQPISMRDVVFCASKVGSDAGLLGAAYLGIMNSKL